MIASYINYSELLKEKRLEGKFHLNPNATYSRLVENSSLELRELSSFGDLFNPSIFKRQYCEKSVSSVPYKQSHDIIKLNYESSVFLSKTQVKKLNLEVEEGWILITGFGTIVGYAGMVDNFLKGCAFANNVARLIVKDKDYNGYLTAFLKSKYGRAQINKNASGSAIRYIEAPGISKTLVPIIKQDLLKQINNDIILAKSIRENGYNSLLKAQEIFLKELFTNEDKNFVKKVDKISISQIKSNSQTRLNGNTFINEGVYTLKQLQNKGVEFKDLKSLKYKVRRPGIFKRVKVNNENGIPYLKGADLSLLDPFAECEYLSKSKTPFIEEMLLKENQILLTCAGNIGFSRIITKEFEEKEAIGSQDIIRIETDQEDFDIYYLFAYLSLDIVVSYINSLRYGSVIHRIEPFHIEELPV